MCECEAKREREREREREIKRATCGRGKGAKRGHRAMARTIFTEHEREIGYNQIQSTSQ